MNNWFHSIAEFYFYFLLFFFNKKTIIYSFFFFIVEKNTFSKLSNITYHIWVLVIVVFVLFGHPELIAFTYDKSTLISSGGPHPFIFLVLVFWMELILTPA